MPVPFPKKTHFMKSAILRHEIIAHNAVHSSTDTGCSIPNSFRCIDLNVFLEKCRFTIKKVFFSLNCSQTQFRMKYISKREKEKKNYFFVKKYITLESHVIVIGICSKTIRTSVPDRVTFNPVIITGIGISLFVVNILISPETISNVYCSFCIKTSRACGHGWRDSEGQDRRITLNVPSTISWTMVWEQISSWLYVTPSNVLILFPFHVMHTLGFGVL